MISDELLPNLMFLAGLALIIVILLRRIYTRTRRNRQQSPSAPRPSRSKSPSQLDAPAEVTRWQVEMHDLSRELRAELDTKAVMVQTLIAMLREEVDRLESVLARAEQTGTAVNSTRGDADLLAEIRRLTAEIAQDGERPLICANDAANELESLAEPEQRAGAGDIGVTIANMSQRGYTVPEIAYELSLTDEEVEAALGPRGK